MITPHKLILRPLETAPYTAVWERMQHFTAERTPETHDELWLLEHPPVYTLGRAARPEHLHDPGEIPVLQVDRGGQVTYHGPGQLLCYPLLDLQRARLGVRRLVELLEDAVIELLAQYDVPGERRTGAPGVYVAGRKLAALGLRVRHGCCYHGLSLNVDMELEPFSRIDPCGYRGLEVTRLRDLGIPLTLAESGERLAQLLAARLGSTLNSANSIDPTDP